MSDSNAAHAHHSIDYVEITVSDLFVAKSFYAGAFGWKFNDYGPEYAGIQGETREVGGLRVDPTTRLHPAFNAPLVILYSKTLDDTTNRVVKAGGTITKPAFAFPGGRRFHFADPTGNELAVWSES